MEKEEEGIEERQAEEEDVDEREDEVEEKEMGEGEEIKIGGSSGGGGGGEGRYIARRGGGGGCEGCQWMDMHEGKAEERVSRGTKERLGGGGRGR